MGSGNREGPVSRDVKGRSKKLKKIFFLKKLLLSLLDIGIT